MPFLYWQNSCANFKDILQIVFCTEIEIETTMKQNAGVVVYRKINIGIGQRPKIEYLILKDTKGDKTPMPPKGTYFHIDFIIIFYLGI